MLHYHNFRKERHQLANHNINSYQLVRIKENDMLHYLLFLQADNCLCYDSLVDVYPVATYANLTCHSFFYFCRLITVDVTLR
jgi:NADH:ubiquinone oxidoreductase subunit C